MGYRFDEEILVPFDVWYKRSTHYEGNDQIQVQKEQSGNWTRIRFKPDGSRVSECGTDGINWQICSE